MDVAVKQRKNQDGLISVRKGWFVSNDKMKVNKLKVNGRLFVGYKV